MTAKMLHIDSKGKILFEKTYKDLTVAHIKIISDTEIVLINKKDENLEIIDLETHKSILVPLHLTIGRTGIVGLLVFPETKYIAVIERKASMGSKVQIRLVYYHLKQIKQGKLWPFSQLKNKLNFYAVHKIDDHSKIGFFQSQLTQQLIFSEVSVDKQLQCRLRTIRTTNNLGTDIKVDRMWQIRPETYLCIILADQDDNNEQKQDKNVLYYHTCIINVDNDSEAVIRKTKFQLKNGPNQIEFKAQSASTIFVQKLSDETSSQKLTIFLVDNKTEQITSVLQQNMAQNQYFISFTRSNSVAKIISNPQSLNFSINHLLLTFTLKEVSMWFLLHLNEDFDDDLLQDAIEMMV